MVCKRCAGAVVCFFLCCFAATAAEEQKGIERFALYVGANNGGSGRELLRYAGTDAMYISKAMTEIGGIAPSNSVILVDPLKDDINNALEALSVKIAKSAFTAKRTEFLFYYSGHSDENALLLGSDTYDYSSLKAAISDIPSDVHIVMLDSCFSGNFIRAKGGLRQKSFLQDDSSVVQGHAYLSSSSESESSQESDSLQGSYFTHALVTGLRGAADTSGDNKVSLNELYYYAHNDTLARTEKSAIGPQHPSYNITLVGSGDLILSDISEADSLIYLPAESAGRFFIRNPAGILISEVNKTAGNKLALALEAGAYTITLVNANNVSQVSVVVEAGKEYAVQPNAFYKVSRTAGRARGGTVEPSFLNADAAVPDETPVQQPVQSPVQNTAHPFPFAISFVSSLGFPMPKPDCVNISLGVLSAADKNIQGVQISALKNSISGNLSGLQSSGFLNYVDGMTSGVQYAGFMNTAKKDLIGMQSAGFMNIIRGNTQGVQAAGFLNISGGTFKGVQGAGFLNIAKADSFVGIQGAGFMNIAQNDIKAIQAAGFMNIADAKFDGIQTAGFMNIADAKFDGIQTAGFMNIADTDFKGFQAAGFMNIADDNFKGVQAAGFMNIAERMTGVQLGVINIATENDGVSLGLFNFIKNGIMSPGLVIDTNGVVYAQYQGGTPYFFTTYMWSMDESSCFFAAGIGTQFRITRMFSVDFELLWKQILTFDADEVARAWEEERNASSIELIPEGVPSIRATLNVRLAKRFAIGIMGSLDFEASNYNSRCFEYQYFSDMKWAVSDLCSVHPSASLVIKL